jgi:hypothetical protein
VGDEDQGGAVFAIKREQQIGNFVPGLAIEVAGGLIGEQQAGRPLKARASATRCCSPPESCAGR